MSQFIALIFFLFSFSIVSVSFAESDLPKPELTAVDEFEKEKDFMPSLSETLSDTNRLKNQIKRQLAREWEADPKNHVDKKNPKGNISHGLLDEIANFGDFEVSISQRTKENWTEVKKPKGNTF